MSIKGITEIIETWVKLSKSIIYADFRENPGYMVNNKLHCELVKSLLRNIKMLKNTDKNLFKISLEKNWINQELLEYMVPEEQKNENEKIDEISAESIFDKENQENENIIRKSEIQQENIYKNIPLMQENKKQENKNSVNMQIFNKRSKSQDKIFDDENLPSIIKSASFTMEHAPKQQRNDCQKCAQYFKDLMLSENRCIALTMENRDLKRKLQIMEASLEQIMNAQKPKNEEETKERIDYLMKEINELMNSLEKPNKKIDEKFKPIRKIK